MPEVGDATLVLFKAVPDAEATREARREFVTRGDRAPTVLFVSLLHGAAHVVRQFDRATIDRLGRFVVLAPETSTRSASAAAAGEQPRDADARETTGASAGETTGTYEHVVLESSENLPHLGSRFTECLADVSDGDGPVRVYFDSVTALLRIASEQTAFKFLHVFRTHLLKAGATGYLHVDPHAHDDRTLSRITTLCDAVVDVSGNGEPV